MTPNRPPQKKETTDWVNIRNASEPATPLILLAQQYTQGGMS